MIPEPPENLNVLTKSPLDPKRIRAIREARGLTQTQAGMMVFEGNAYPAQQWNSYESPRNGRPKRARHETVMKIAAVLGCNVADLMVGAVGGIQVIPNPAAVAATPAPVSYTADDLQAAYQMGMDDGRAAALGRGQALGQSLDVKA